MAQRIKVLDTILEEQIVQIQNWKFQIATENNCEILRHSAVNSHRGQWFPRKSNRSLKVVPNIKSMFEVYNVNLSGKSATKNEHLSFRYLSRNYGISMEKQW